MGKTLSSLLSAALLASFCGTASAFTLSGTVLDDTNKPLEGADVKLMKRNMTTETDAKGHFSFEGKDNMGIQETGKAGYFSLANGILNFSQGTNSPVNVKVFDLVGNQVYNKTLQGSGTMDLSASIEAQGTYLAKISLGKTQQTIRFNAYGNYSGSFGTNNSNALQKTNGGSNDVLRIIADGFDTLTMDLTNLDTTLTIKMSKIFTSGEQTYAFGYALKNAPRKSKGCGKTGNLKGTINYQCGGKDDCSAQQFSINAGGLNRTYYMTFPKNYDNTKPYKLLIANHCMGSESNHIATWVDHDQDHISPYYSQKALDTEGNYIFVAPQGESNGTWQKGEKDHQFIDALISHIEDNYCIDTSRVFATGFSFGAMFTNSLAQTFQHRIRAVAVYAVADFNIYIPANAGKPIAWMDVHGVDDGLCTYSKVDDAINRILANNGPNGTDARGEKATKWSSGPHVCYDYKNVDPRFPVKLCTWKGGHQWTANDDGNYRNTWVPKAVHEFFEQF